MSKLFCKCQNLAAVPLIALCVAPAGYGFAQTHTIVITPEDSDAFTGMQLVVTSLNKNSTSDEFRGIELTAIHSHNASSHPGMNVIAVPLDVSNLVLIEGVTDNPSHVTFEGSYVVNENGTERSNLFNLAKPDSLGRFHMIIVPDSEMWVQDGPYEIRVWQNESPEYDRTVSVEIVDGKVIPEFGAVAMLMLLAGMMAVVVAVNARVGERK